jgi:hypothetical protein
MKRRELFWMLIPCLLFAGMALWMGAREAKLPPDDGRIGLVIEKVETRPIHAKEAADGYDTEVAVILNYKGPKPSWWGKQSGNYGGSEHNARLFYEANGKTKAAKLPPHFKDAPPIFYWRPGWKSDTERYEARYFLKLSALPPRPEKTVLRSKIAVEDSALSPHVVLSQSVPLVFTVRGPNQIVKPAQVSRDPMLRIIKTEIKKPTAAEQKTNGGYDTEVQVSLLDLKPNDPGGSTHGGDEVVDEKGNPIRGGKGWSTSSGTTAADPLRPILKFGCTLKAYPRSQRNIFVKMKYSQGDRWPLIVKVPLRLKGKDVKGKVHAKQESFEQKSS